MPRPPYRPPSRAGTAGRRGIEPMKANAGELPANDEGWAYEVKWDGYRTIAWVAGDQLMLQSSNLIDVTAKWPALHGLATHVNADSAVLDGEVVCFDSAGRSRFEWLQQGSHPVTFVVFDVLGINGHETMGLPYEQRRQLLATLVEPGESWIVPAFSTGLGSGAALASSTQAAGAEGIVAKRLDSPYVPGKRATTWRKIKHRLRQEFVIGGWTEGTGARSSTFGSVALGYYEGDELRFCGTAGSGFDQARLDSTHRWMKAHELPVCPFTPTPPREVTRVSRWCQPLLIAECAFAEWTAEGLMRHPVFLGLRDDKSPHDVTRSP
jgi:bifunctional non-homologous end joining protein LigD